ncbi:MAG: T9SS type A sorting domain-containing protein [Bacteroidota bacterium]
MNAGLNIILVPVFLFSVTILHSQSTNISGVINTYHSVVEIIPAKSCIRVSNTTGLSVSESVMIIQMKGASVLTNNNVNFGDTISVNNAGNYELNSICGIRGDSVFLFFGILNNYTLSGKVQLIGVPTYYSAVVTGTLSAQPWNNVSGTGGVIALNVDENLTLNAPVSADGSGFYGGAYVLSNGTCSNIGAATAYIYNANTTNPQNGAFKGESVYEFPAAQSGGRGAPANGGGGGNNHNNGGGGGANLANGGDGGGNSSSTGCTTNLKGLGGKALSSWNGRKIFLGGGGGAGHSNNTVSTGGGNGGGIIFIRAKNLISNNTKISANGNTGGGSVSDGAAGGGGGGTIIASITNYSGTLSIEAKGGNGGNSNDGGNIKRCYGAGGGGGGGGIYFSGSIPAVTITAAGGTAGPETSRDPACNVAVPAIAGNAGSLVSNYTYITSLAPSNYCLAVPLPLSLLYFKALVSDKQTVALQWKLSEPPAGKTFVIERSVSMNKWLPLSTVIISTESLNYQSIDDNPFEGISFYRLKIINQSGSFFYSALQQINIIPASERLKIYPNPAKDKISIEGELPVNIEIKFLSAEGKLIFTKHISLIQQKINLELPALASGVYFLQINTQVRKIIIR